MNNTRKSMGWVDVEQSMPLQGRAIEMMDDEGRILTGRWDGNLWRFNYWGSGRPITMWRYIND